MTIEYDKLRELANRRYEVTSKILDLEDELEEIHSAIEKHIRDNKMERYIYEGEIDWGMVYSC